MTTPVKTPKISIDELPHIVIRASAGSGKTYQLSNRYLDLLHHDHSPQSILATTFTRKAAGEILERILRRLAQASADPKFASELDQAIKPSADFVPAHPTSPLTQTRAQVLLKTLCRSLHRVTVSTIDSFFTRIASSFRHELRLPLDPRMADEGDPLVVQIRAQAIEAMLGDFDFDLFLDLLKRLHHDSAKRGVTQAIDDIVANLYDTYRATTRDQWHQLKIAAPPPFTEIIPFIHALDDLAATATDKRFADAIRKAREAAMHADWKTFLGSGLAAAIANNTADPVYSRKPLTAEQIAAYIPLINHAKNSLLHQLAQQTTATFDLLEQFDIHYTTLRDQHRLLLYSDLPHKLAHELPARGDDLLMEICYRLDSSVGHLLLDEFQDTSFDQWTVLEPFASEITSFSDSSRTFFCVGDVKQAIYGWRGGRAELFNHIVEHLHLPGPSQISLDVSFRSSQIVLDTVNQVFESLPDSKAWKQDVPDREVATQWAADFAEHNAFKKLPGYVEFITSPALHHDDATSYHDEADAGEAEANLPQAYEAFVAAKIDALHRQAPHLSIGVLVSRNVAAKSLISNLRDRGVDASGEGAGGIIGDPAVDVILSALRLADHPGHSAAAFHVLNSPLGPVIGLRTMRPAHCEAIALSIRSRILMEGYATVLADWARQLAPSCNDESARRLMQLVTLADQFQPDGTPRTRHFIETVEHARLEEPSVSPVRVMTIHKSKGLEFDIVVLPELGKKIGHLSSGQAVMIDRDDQTDVIHAVYRATSDTVRSLHPDLQKAHDQERTRRLRDDLCSLYVAMTRAKHALHLITEPLEMTKKGSFRSAGIFDQSFAALLRHALCDKNTTENVQGNQVLFQLGDESWMDDISEPAPSGSDTPRPATQPARIKPQAARSRRMWRLVAPSSLHDVGHVNVADLLAITPDQPRLRGTLMHAWCQPIEWLDDPAGQPRDEDLHSKARLILPARMGHDEKWIAEQITQFRSMIARPEVRATLSKPKQGQGESPSLWREQSFAVRTDGDLLRGTFDRVMLVSRDRKVVRAELIDYKTDRIATESEMDARIEHYRPQMTAYRTALSLMLGLPAKQITASLLFLATGARRNL